MTDWITDRLPTKVDADRNGFVYVCTSPQLNKELFDCENWHDVTLGWPWRHSGLWTPPTPAPESAPAAPEPEPKPKTEQWITDRPPTKKDADAVDHVLIRRHPDSPFTWHVYWQYATGAPWRHTDLWWDPWGENSNSKSKPPTVCKNCYTSYDSTEPRCPNCGFGFVPEPEPEPEKATRGFAWFNRVDVNPGHEVEEYAVATDGTAWWRIIGKDDPLKVKKWIRVRPLPQPGEE